MYRAFLQPCRRGFLRAVAGLAVLPVFGLRSAAATEHGGFHLVNGWVLTDADLEALDRHDR